MHTVYGGADLFRTDSMSKMGKVALQTLTSNAANFVEFAQAIHLEDYEKLPTDEAEIQALIQKLDNSTETQRRQNPAWLAYTTYHKVIEKLQTEPVEDFRIDFEGGFGNRSWEEENCVAEQVANECAKGMEAGTLSPFIGIRIKPFTEDLKERGVRTMDIFLTALAAKTGEKLLENFVVTLPKVAMPQQITALVRLFKVVETNTAIPTGALKYESRAWCNGHLAFRWCNECHAHRSAPR